MVPSIIIMAIPFVSIRCCLENHHHLHTHRPHTLDQVMVMATVVDAAAAHGFVGKDGPSVGIQLFIWLSSCDPSSHGLLNEFLFY
jgi:hypothetical protein